MNDRVSQSTDQKSEFECTYPKSDEVTNSALRRLSASGIDPIIPRFDCLVALNLSAPTVSRMQRRFELPFFEEISPGRKGWKRAVLIEVLDGRRDWEKSTPQTLSSCVI